MITSFTPRKYPEKMFSFYGQQSKKYLLYIKYILEKCTDFFKKGDVLSDPHELQCLVEGKEMTGERKNLKQMKNVRIMRHFKTNG